MYTLYFEFEGTRDSRLRMRGVDRVVPAPGRSLVLPELSVPLAVSFDLPPHGIYSYLVALGDGSTCVREIEIDNPSMVIDDLLDLLEATTDPNFHPTPAEAVYRRDQWLRLIVDQMEGFRRNRCFTTHWNKPIGEVITDENSDYESQHYIVGCVSCNEEIGELNTVFDEPAQLLIREIGESVQDGDICPNCGRIFLDTIIDQVAKLESRIWNKYLKEPDPDKPTKRHRLPS